MGKLSVLACITCQMSSINIIKTAFRFADGWGAKLYVLCVLPEGQLSDEVFDLLDTLRCTAKEHNAEFNVIFDNSPAFAAVGFAKRKHISCVFTGEPAEEGTGFVAMLESVLPKVKITIVHKDGALTHLSTNLYVEARAIVPVI